MNDRSNPGSANLDRGVASGWRNRGYLPHFEKSELTQHVTFHLADSLPNSVMQRLEQELKSAPAAERDLERRKRMDDWIDAGHGSSILTKPAVAEIVQDSLLAFDLQRYRLFAWVVMPNHVHALFQPMAGWNVAKIVASWKKFTARKIHDELQNGSPSSGEPVWHKEYWDRYIRDQAHFEGTVEYIHMNPVKAGLVTTAADWPWSSAFPGSANLPIGGFLVAFL